MSEKLKLMEFDSHQLMSMVQRQFQFLNDDDDLTAEDKKRLKEYYLEHFITPRARTVLRQHFPEDFAHDAEHKSPEGTEARSRP